MSVSIIAETNASQIAGGLRGLNRRLGRAQQRAARRVGRESLRRWRRTVATWSRQPEFTVETNLTRDGLEVLSGTDDRIYGFLNYGTAIRRAIMSDDFSPKTSPGSLLATGGGGRVVFIGPNVIRPGIAPRNFDQLVHDEIEPLAPKIFQNEVGKEARKRLAK